MHSRANSALITALFCFFVGALALIVVAAVSEDTFALLFLTAAPLAAYFLPVVIKPVLAIATCYLLIGGLWGLSSPLSREPAKLIGALSLRLALLMVAPTLFTAYWMNRVIT